MGFFNNMYRKVTGSYRTLKGFWDDVDEIYIRHLDEYTTDYYCIEVKHFDGTYSMVRTIPGSWMSLGAQIGTDETVMIWFTSDEAVDYANRQMMSVGKGMNNSDRL